MGSLKYKTHHSKINVHVGNRHKPIRFLPGMNIPLMSGRVKQYSRELFRDKNSMENMPFGGL